MALCQATVQLLTSPPTLRPSLFPASGQPAGARVQGGCSPQSCSSSLRDTQGAVWGPTPSSVCAPASPRDSAARCGVPVPDAASVSPSLFPCQGFVRDLVPRQQCQRGKQPGVWAERDGGRSAARFPFWQKAPQPGQVPGARQLLGAAGATSADGCKMSQWEPKSGWHPVFNHSAGGRREAPWRG